jgi:hypothetical protein
LAFVVNAVAFVVVLDVIGNAVVVVVVVDVVVNAVIVVIVVVNAFLLLLSLLMLYCCFCRWLLKNFF